MTHMTLNSDYYDTTAFTAVESMMGMTISQVIRLIDASGLDERQMLQVVQDLRKGFQTWVGIFAI